MAGEAKERLKDRFWLVLHEPGCVPERKGPWLDQKGEMARVLREFMKARPTAYIDVLTLDHDGPTVHHGPEMLQMIDGRSMSRGRRHNAQTRQAHASAHARLAELTRLREENGTLRAYFETREAVTAVGLLNATDEMIARLHEATMKARQALSPIPQEKADV